MQTEGHNCALNIVGSFLPLHADQEENFSDQQGQTQIPMNGVSDAPQVPVRSEDDNAGHEADDGDTAADFGDPLELIVVALFSHVGISGVHEDGKGRQMVARTGYFATCLVDKFAAMLTPLAVVLVTVKHNVQIVTGANVCI